MTNGTSKQAKAIEVMKNLDKGHDFEKAAEKIAKAIGVNIYQARGYYRYIAKSNFIDGFERTDPTPVVGVRKTFNRKSDLKASTAPAPAPVETPGAQETALAPQADQASVAEHVLSTIDKAMETVNNLMATMGGVSQPDVQAAPVEDPAPLTPAQKAAATRAKNLRTLKAVVDAKPEKAVARKPAAKVAAARKASTKAVIAGSSKKSPAAKKGATAH